MNYLFLPAQWLGVFKRARFYRMCPGRQSNFTCGVSDISGRRPPAAPYLFDLSGARRPRPTLRINKSMKTKVWDRGCCVKSLTTSLPLTHACGYWGASYNHSGIHHFRRRNRNRGRWPSYGKFSALHKLYTLCPLLHDLSHLMTQQYRVSILIAIDDPTHPGQLGRDISPTNYDTCGRVYSDPYWNRVIRS